MGKIQAFYRRHSVRGPVATFLVLWGVIGSILDWIGLIDQVRSMMDPHHWLTHIIFWPHLNLVISVIGVALLVFLISKETPSGKADTQASAPVATDKKETDKWRALFREREQLKDELSQLKQIVGMDEDDVRREQIKIKEQRVIELTHMMSADLRRQLRNYWHEDL